MSRASRRARRALDELHAKGLNFDLTRRTEFTPDNGWRLDEYRQPLPPEPPGPPAHGGSWEIGARLIRDYEFADPGVVRAVYHPDRPLERRDMLLEIRFVGLRFLVGVRVGGVNDAELEIDGRRVRVWGWNYRTLQGHLEMGQMDYEVWKWIDDGGVEFRIRRVSKVAVIPNPVVRLGVRVFGRWLQVRFVRRSCARMLRLVRQELAARGAAAPDRPPTKVTELPVRPIASDARARRKLTGRRS